MSDLMALPRPLSLFRILFGFGGVVFAAIALGGDAPSPLMRELAAFEQKLQVVFYPTTEFDKNPSLINAETELFKDLVAIADKIRIASEKATPETLLEIQELTTEWSRLRLNCVDESLRKYYRGEGAEAYVRMWATLPLRLARKSVEKLIPENPFVFLNADAEHVGLIVSEHDLSLKEFGVLVSEPAIDHAYEKILFFSAMRTEMINRWAYQRIGMAAENFPYRGNAIFNPISLKGDNGQRLINELWTNDAYDAWQNTDLQGEIAKYVLSHLPSPDETLVNELETVFSATKGYQDFFDFVSVDARRNKLKSWINQHALSNRTLRIAGAAPSIIGSAFLPQDDILANDLPVSKTAQLISKRLESVEHDEVVSSLLDLAQASFKIKPAAFRTALTKAVDAAFTKADRARAVGIEAVVRAYWKSPRLESEMKVRFEKKLNGYVLGTTEFFPVYSEWKTVKLQKKSGLLSVNDPRHNLILNARELQAYFIFRLAKENDSLKWRYDKSAGLRDILERYFKAIEMFYNALPVKEQTGAKLSQIAHKTSQAFIKFYLTKDAEIAERDRKEDELNQIRKRQEERRFDRPVLMKADAVAIKPVQKPIPTSFILPKYFELLNLVGANPASVRILKTNGDLAYYLEHKVVAFKALVPLSRETWPMTPIAGVPCYGPNCVPDLDLLDHIQVSAWNRDTRKLNQATVKRIYTRALGQAFVRHKKYVTDLVTVDLLRPNSDPFRTLMESTVAMREILIQFRAEMREKNPFLPDFAPIDKALVEESKTFAERVYHTSQMILLGVVVAIVLIGAAKLTVMSFGLAAPVVFASAMAFLGQLVIPLTTLGVYSALQVHLVEKPQSIAYQEMLLGSRIAEGTPKSISTFARKNNETLAGLFNQSINTDESMAKVQKKETTSAIMDIGFAAVDGYWLVHLARASSGWKAVQAYMRLKQGSAAPSMTRVFTRVPPAPLLAKPIATEAAKMSTAVKVATAADKTADGIKAETKAAEKMTPSRYKEMVTIADIQELKLAKVADTLENGLDDFSLELSEQIRSYESGLKTNGEIARKFTLSEVSAHPEITDYGIYLRALFGKTDLVHMASYDWRGVVTITEVLSFERARALQWLTQYGKLRQTALKLRGVILKQDIIEPLKMIQAKKRMIVNSGKRGLTLDQWAARYTLTAKQAARWKNARHDGDRLIAVLSPSELDALETASQTSSFFERFTFVDRLKNWLRPNFLRKLNTVFKDAGDAIEFVPRSVYNPDHYLPAIERKINDALGKPGEEVSNREIYEQLLRGEIEPTDPRVVAVDFKQYKAALEALERGNITTDEVRAAAAEFDLEYQNTFAQ